EVGKRFWLCLDCGRHLPYDVNDSEQDERTRQQIKQWNEYHAQHCKGEVAPLILAYKFQTDVLVLNVQTRKDSQTIGRSTFSIMAVTLAEALLAGAASLLELEAGELAAFVRKNLKDSIGEQIVFYETVPGGAGYLEEMAERLPEVAQAAIGRLYGHDCRKACYLCLKHYRNQRWHAFFDKDQIRDLLVDLSALERVSPIEAKYGAGMKALQDMLQARASGSDPKVRRYPKGEIEEPLRAALGRAGVPEGEREYEIFDEQGRLITVPDFCWPDIKLAVYCDGFSVHAHPDVLELDAQKRNFLQTHGWAVLTYWGRTILKNPDACAQQVAELYRQRSGQK
ncbi:MAG: DUF1998 domain-containing protein, partial [Bacillota bacterium]|nr:DUF1998 domain-containing protein [Bacillota bacterium]